MQTDATGILDDLVNQFSDPMSCLRELIQNAIDAGSGEVEIDVKWSQEADGGLLTVHVDDFGEGMTREIIETKLTRLFSSGKDEDFTKIGRFGIGFVSVFALAPFLVCVDTGRAGEYWRVLFKEDRTFDLIALETPVEGTQIRIFKRCTRQEYVEFRRRAREVVSHWCRHVKVPIHVCGEEINEPFELAEALCSVTYEEEGTRIVAGFVSDVYTRGGFFNRGLTLKDDVNSEWEGVAFKIDSRYLEHTLTRDQVLKDKHYHKAHKLLDRVIREDLVHALLEKMEELASEPEHHAAWHEHFAQLLRWLESWGDLGVIEKRALLCTMYQEPLTARQLRKLVASEKVVWAHKRHALSDALQASKDHVVLGGVGAHHYVRWQAFLDHIHPGFVLPVMEERWKMCVLSARHDQTGAARLRDEIRVALGALGGLVEGVDVVRWVDGVEMPHKVFVCDMLAGEPVGNEVVKGVSRQELLRARRLGLLDSYALLGEALRLVVKEPEWAALLMVKAMLLQDSDGMRLEDEGMLTRHMVERRERRLSRHTQEVSQ